MELGKAHRLTQYLGQRSKMGVFNIKPWLEPEDKQKGSQEACLNVYMYEHAFTL